MNITEVSLWSGKNKFKLLIPKSKLRGVFTPRFKPGLSDLYNVVRSAMKNPLESKSLENLITSRKNIAIVVDDISRPIPTSLLVKPLLDAIQENGGSFDKVTIIIAIGVHRENNPQEFKVILGNYFDKVKCINHNPDNSSELTYLGKTSYGTNVHINKTFAEADLRIVIADVEYHQFCGYGGGAKSIFPGIADRAAIESNHSRFALPKAEIGIWKDNPVRQEIEEVGRMVEVDFSISVVLNYEKQIVKVVCGGLQTAFLDCTCVVDNMYKHSIDKAVDLVISSPGGYPKDIDLYQSQKAVSAAAKIVKNGGKIIVLAKCQDGYGSELFYSWVKNADCVEDIITEHNKKFVLGGHKAYFFARDILKANVFLHSSMEEKLVREFFIEPITINEITQLIHQSESIAVLPFASSTNIVVKSENY